MVGRGVGFLYDVCLWGVRLPCTHMHWKEGRDGWCVVGVGGVDTVIRDGVDVHDAGGGVGVLSSEPRLTPGSCSEC
jgi:hypothetical protein